MREYSFPVDGWQRIIGRSQETNLGMGIFRGNCIEQVNLHKHTQSEEYYLTVQGKGRFWIERHVYLLEPGHVIKVEKGEAHSLIAVDEAPLEVYSLQIPGVLDKEIVEAPEELIRLIEEGKKRKRE